MNAPQIAQNGVIGLIMESGLVAKLVLLMLFGASVLCWGIILMKWKAMRRAQAENGAFLNVFWHGKSVDEIFAQTDKFPASPIAAVFKSGYVELKKLSAAELSTAQELAVANISRALSRASSSEVSVLEKHVSWLATVASASPFVGLFGTVWGIMNSFQGIGATGAANLAVVAPGISEALITTATGIAAAVPAVIAYNSFVGQIKKVAVEMDCFSQDFLNIIQRSVSGRHGG